MNPTLIKNISSDFDSNTSSSTSIKQIKPINLVNFISKAFSDKLNTKSFFDKSNCSKDCKENSKRPNVKKRLLSRHKEFFKRFKVQNERIPYKPKPNRVWLPCSSGFHASRISNDASSVYDPRDCELRQVTILDKMGQPMTTMAWVPISH